jgi:hypothetical protein
VEAREEELGVGGLWIWRWRGGAASAHVRGIGRQSDAWSPPTPLLLACLRGEGKREYEGKRAASPLFFVKHSLCCFICSRAVLSHLAGQGSEEVVKGDLMVAQCRGSSHLEPLEIRLSSAFHLRRRFPAAAT